MSSKYIGITGFMQQADTLKMIRIAEQHATSIHDSRKLMVGVLVGSKTIAGIPNKYPQRYPKIDSAHQVFVANPRVLNLYHYNTDKRDTFDQEMEIILSKETTPCSHGFQLNMIWPEQAPLQRALDKHPKLEIILQLGGTALQQKGQNPTEIANAVSQYARHGLVTGALFDPSGGKGKEFNPEFARACVLAIREACPTLKYVGVAGGLSPDNVEEFIEPLLQIDPNLSWDAEGRLRTSEDHLDLEKASHYLNHSFDVATRYA